MDDDIELVPKPDLENDRDAWLKHGIDQGWISESYCMTHGLPPLTAEEQAYIDQEDPDEGPCGTAVRVW